MRKIIINIEEDSDKNLCNVKAFVKDEKATENEKITGYILYGKVQNLLNGK